MKNKLKFAIVYGSTRKKRLGIRFVKYLANQISKNKHTPMIVDPLENKLPLLDKRFDEFNKNKAPKPLKNIHKLLNEADAIILVSAEYNHMPPPALINLLNYFYKEFDRKPSTVCTYSVGDFAGVRVQGPLRTLMTQLGSPPIKFGMYQGKISRSLNEKGEPKDPKDTEERFNIFFKELELYAKALKKIRKI